MPAELDIDLATIKDIFRLMREERVFVFRGMGLEVQMSQNAWPEPALKMPGIEHEPQTDVALEDMPPELAGPYMAFRPRVDPTHPDRPIDDAAEQGLDLPGE